MRATVDGDVLPPLPSFEGGGTLIDIADREELYAAMEVGGPRSPPASDAAGAR